MKVIKKMIMIVFLLLTMLIILDFIPVKFAISIDDTKMNLKEGDYICINESKIHLEIPWIAIKRFNKHLDHDFLVRVYGNSPYGTLSAKEFEVLPISDISNVYLLNGEVKRFEKEENSNILIADLYVNKWQIIYPINRASFRQFYAPKSYLTVYDYDWIKVIKSMWKKANGDGLK